MTFEKEEKTMYRVEKFLPPECPKCRNKFLQEGRDWTRLLGDIVDGQKKIRETDGYTIIVCKCGNYTAQIQLESYQIASKEKAERLVREEGFVNLMKVKAVGNMTRDMHAVYTKKPGVKVMSVPCEEGGKD